MYNIRNYCHDLLCARVKEKNMI